MRIYNTSGLIGDTYVNCCKLHDIKEEIIIHHSQPYPQFNDLIRAIYKLIPNIKEVLIYNHNKSIANPKYPYFNSFPKYFPGDTEEVKMNFFPRFNFNSDYDFEFPYVVLQPKSGRPEQKRELFTSSIKKVIKKSPYKVVLIGTDKKYEIIKHINCINLINKTSIFDAFSIIQKSKYYIGFWGAMAMVALSNRINSNYVYYYQGDLIWRIEDTPWEMYSKYITSLLDYSRSQKPFYFTLRSLKKFLYKNIFKFKALVSLSDYLRRR